MSGDPQARRSRHLMDPNAPRKVASREDVARLQTVQRRVMTALVVTTILHLSAGLVIFALAIDEGSQVERIGLCVISAVFGVMGCASGLAINKRSILSPWLLPGLIPGIVGIALILA